MQVEVQFRFKHNWKLFVRSSDYINVINICQKMNVRVRQPSQSFHVSLLEVSPIRTRNVTRNYK